MSILRAVKFVQYILENKTSKNCVAIDATMGNGNDTLFLSKLVGKEGKVYSFDIQHVALEKTERLLKNNMFDVTSLENIKLLLEGHENIDKYVTENIDIAMFNLGYLPGGDHRVITRAETTIKAINCILQRLNKGGIVSLVVYYGHEKGEEEKDEIMTFIKNLDPSKYMVLKCEYMNEGNYPPIIMFIEKK